MLSASVPSSGSQSSDFSLLPPLLHASTPAYFLFRLDSPSHSPQFIFYSYVPDTSPVRQKMLYASTRATLVRFLSPSRLATTIHCSVPEELSLAAYDAHVESEAAPKARTEREAEIERLRQAEAAAVEQAPGAGEGTPLFGEGKGKSGWTDEAVGKVREFGESEVGAAIRLVSGQCGGTDATVLCEGAGGSLILSLLALVLTGDQQQGSSGAVRPSAERTADPRGRPLVHVLPPLSRCAPLYPLPLHS